MKVFDGLFAPNWYCAMPAVLAAVAVCGLSKLRRIPPRHTATRFAFLAFLLMLIPGVLVIWDWCLYELTELGFVGMVGPWEHATRLAVADLMARTFGFLMLTVAVFAGRARPPEE